MAARSENVSITKEDGSAKFKPSLNSMDKAKAVADWGVSFSCKVDEVRKAVLNNEDALMAASSTMGGILTGLTAVPYVGIAAQLTKSLLEQVDKASAVQTLVDKSMVETLQWFEEQDLDKTLGSVPRSAGSLQELKKTMLEAALLAETVKGKGWGNRFFLAAPYEAKLKGKLESLREIRTKLGVEATWATTKMAALILDLLLSSGPEAITARHNVPEVDPLFEGREEILGRVHETFWPMEGTSRGARVMVCLWGLRGIGKTQLARKYCHEHLGQYGRILWVDVHGKGAQGAYADIGADVLGVTRAHGEQLEDYVKRVRLTIQNLTEPFLMVFDGANGDDIGKVGKLLPGSHQACHVLVTTTNDWALRQHEPLSLAVDSLSTGQARVLLRKGLAAGAEALSAETEKKLDELAERLGYLTIALAGAVPLLEERRLERDPVGNLLEELQRIGGVGPANELFELSLHSLGRLQRGEDAGSEVVCRFATSIAMVAGWFGEGPAQTEVLLEAAIRYYLSTHGERDKSLLHDETLSRKALQRVTHYLPAQVATGAGGRVHEDIASSRGCCTLTSHVLFLEYVRRSEGASTARTATLAVIAGATCVQEMVQQFRGVWDVAVLYLDALDSSGLENLRQLGNEYATYLLLVGGDYETARIVLESGMKVFGQGPEGWEWKLLCAEALESLGRYVDAAGVVEAVVKELEARDATDVLKPQRKRLTWLCCFRQQDSSPPAADVDIKSNASDSDVSGNLANASVDVARAWHIQASIYSKQARDAEAVQLYKRSLGVKEKQLGLDHFDVAATLNNMAGLLEDQGKHEEAMPMYEQALRIGEKVLGPDHPHVATTVHNMAGLFASQGKYEKAMPLYEQSLCIKKKALGLDHPEVAITVHNMGTLLGKQGRFEEALRLYERALGVQEKILGRDHPSVAGTLGSMGNLLFNQGQYEEALPLVKRALEIREKKLGSEHPNTKVSRTDLEGLEKKMVEAAVFVNQASSSVTADQPSE